MNSLLQLFNSLPQDQWDYYSEIQAESFLQNPFGENAISNEEFIEQYFFRSGKERIIKNKNFDIKSSLTEQAAHTTSIFFLGSLIYHNTRIREVLFPQELNPAGYSVFPFLWFLSCLFHDLGYNYETESNQYVASIHDIDSLKGKF
jgi:predicted HD phosphohydrolase